MGELSKIEWTDHTFNPWWGCEKVSPGCKHCYAETFAKRVGLDVWGANPRRTFGESRWREPLKWNKAAEKGGVRARVFCASMADVFEDRDDVITERTKLWDLIEATPHLDWLLLTKRPQNIRQFIRGSWLRDPRPNVWLGTTAEDQQRFDERHYDLLSTPAAIHFFSVEPMLGPVSLRGCRPAWVIVGGESGHGARPMEEAWVSALRDECTSSGVSFFYKQKIVGRTKVSLPMLDGRTWAEVPR